MAGGGLAAEPRADLGETAFEAARGAGFPVLEEERALAEEGGVALPLQRFCLHGCRK